MLECINVSKSAINNLKVLQIAKIGPKYCDKIEPKYVSKIAIACPERKNPTRIVLFSGWILVLNILVDRLSVLEYEAICRRFTELFGTELVAQSYQKAAFVRDK